MRLVLLLLAAAGALNACSECDPGPAPCPLEPLSGPRVNLVFSDGGPATTLNAEIRVVSDGGSPEMLRAFRLGGNSTTPFVVDIDLLPVEGQYQVQIASDAGVGVTAPFRVTGSRVTGTCTCGAERRMALLDVDGGVDAVIPESAR